MMSDVLIALAPALGVAVFLFQWHAVVQVGLCVLACLAAETACALLRGRGTPITDYSAGVTGIILGLSLPGTAPWYVAVLASVVAIGLGKVVFGGLGYNLFNPAMVGRAFVMLSFAGQMGASAYVNPDSRLSIVTEATPLTTAKQAAKQQAPQSATDAATDGPSTASLQSLALGQVNGSLGETSALALLLGGLYLCIRRTASWRIPAGMILGTGVAAQLAFWAGLTLLGAAGHLMAGAFLFGAFFIATDPVTSPLTNSGKFLFGLGIGLLVVIIRLFSGYPEGLMFAVLVMNAAVPLINRWTIPNPLGGPIPAQT